MNQFDMPTKDIGFSSFSNSACITFKGLFSLISANPISSMKTTDNLSLFSI